jgi:hypothetical protein
LGNKRATEPSHAWLHTAAAARRVCCKDQGLSRMMT